MLSAEEMQEITAEMKNYADPQAVRIDALRIIQHHRGWVSDEALQDVAKFLNMDLAELDSVATFYNLIYRQPVGRHVILVCNSVSCWVMGYEKVREHLKNLLGIDLGETTPDGRFTLLPNVCLGICSRAPALMIGSDTYTNLDETKLPGILEQYA